MRFETDLKKDDVMKNNKFNVYGRYTQFPYYAVLSGLLTFFILIYIFYAGYVSWGEVDWLIMIMIILCLIGIACSIYVVYYTVMIKTLMIDDKGVKYYFNGKLKLFLPWKKIEKVETRGLETKRFILLIFTNEKTINLSMVTFGIPKEALINAFEEMLKYQPKYNFKVIDEYVRI
jgi:hypothetical protein